VARRFGQYAVQYHEDRSFAPLNKDWNRNCRRRAAEVQGYRTAAFAAQIVVVRLVSRGVAFSICVVIAAVKANRSELAIRIYRITGAKSTKHDIQREGVCGDENARSSPAVPKRVHLFGCYNQLCGRIFPN
jgi:hypothetical protein